MADMRTFTETGKDSQATDMVSRQQVSPQALQAEWVVRHESMQLRPTGLIQAVRC
jgi:hypothetical protein